MKTYLHLFLSLMLVTCLADDAKVGEQSITGWGKTVDPAQDCKFAAKDGKLTILVPGSEEAHDLGAELSSMTAPRVLQPLSGDFVLKVRVDGEFAPGGDSTQPGRTGYTGAGLVVFADERNYVRLERATLHAGGGEEDAHPYTNFEIRVNGALERFGTTGDLPTENGKPTWLQLERKGMQMIGAMSHDGERWAYGEPKELTADAWKKNEVLAGVAAISTSRQPFAPIYSAFSARSGDKVDAPGISGTAPGKDGAELLQGRWEGVEVGREDRGKCTLTVTGQALYFQGTNQEEWYKASFTLPLATNPKQLVGTITDCPAPEMVGKSSVAIYKLEADKLTLVGYKPGSPEIPKSFDGEPASRTFVFKKLPPSE